MKTISITGRGGECRVLLGSNLRELPHLAPGTQVIIITDQVVGRLYGHLFPDWPVIRIGIGERHKTLATATAVYCRLLELGADRHAFLVGIGGGVVCDVTGFVASTYMRGMAFAFVPSTLLAQVDAAIGGKNGVNFLGYKNLVGTFSQPQFVLCDLRLLKTLSAKEVHCGIAEMIKAAAIADAKLFELLETRLEQVQELEEGALARAVAKAVAVKAAVVNRDEREKGERRKLNFGHTLGHALERALAISHGEAVAIGMVAAARLSVKKGLLAEGDCLRLETLISRSGLPVTIPAAGKKAVRQAMAKDKKKEGKRLHLVLLKKLGQATVVPVPLTELGEVIP